MDKEKNNLRIENSASKLFTDIQRKTENNWLIGTQIFVQNSDPKILRGDIIWKIHVIEKGMVLHLISKKYGVSGLTVLS
jgi:hypothetical protein